MSDLSRLTEAIELFEEYGAGLELTCDLSYNQMVGLFAAARLVVEGQDWSVCEAHRSAVQWSDATNCRVGYYENDTLSCRMVSARLTFPKQGAET